MAFAFAFLFIPFAVAVAAVLELGRIESVVDFDLLYLEFVADFE